MEKMNNILISLLLFLTTVLIVDGLKTCDNTIVKNILSRKDCPTDLLKTLHGMSPFTYTFNPNGTVPDRVKCAKGVIDQPCDKKAAAHVIVEYKNTSIPNLIQNYQHEEVCCGHIREWDVSNKEYQIYVFKNELVFCYYRCTTYVTEGDQFAAGAVPLKKRSDPAVLAAVKTCKDNLKAAGVNVALMDMTTCSE